MHESFVIYRGLHLDASFTHSNYTDNDVVHLTWNDDDGNAFYCQVWIDMTGKGTVKMIQYFDNLSDNDESVNMESVYLD